MSDDLGLPDAPMPAASVPWTTPEEVQRPKPRQRWGVVAVVAVLGVLLVGAAAFYRNQQHNDLSSAKRTRAAAEVKLKDAQNTLTIAQAHYNTVKRNYDLAVRVARILALQGSELSAKATAATQELTGYSDIVHNLTQAWLNGNVSEFNRLVGEANSRAAAVNDATDAMGTAAQQILGEGTSND